jgi:hypothetical protein
MEATRFNFKQVRQKFLENLDSASFVAFDLEMTGINSEKRNKTDLPFENYLKAFNASNRYSVIQMGICLFKHLNPSQELDDDGVEHDFLRKDAKFEAFPFTFYLFPRSYDGMLKRDVVMEVSSIEYNVFKHGINWNKWVAEGIGYSDAYERSVLKEFISSNKCKCFYHCYNLQCHLYQT